MRYITTACSSPPAVLILAAAASIAAGVAEPLLPLRASGALIAALAALLLVAFGRTIIRRTTRLANMHSVDAGSFRVAPARVDPGQAVKFRSARRVYYLGLVCLCMLTIRASGQVTISDLLFLLSASLVAAEVVILRREVSMRVPALVLFGMTVFSMGGVISSFDASLPFKSVLVVARIIFLALFWFWLATLVLQRREHIEKAITVWVTSAAICSAGAVVQIFDGSIIPGGTNLGDRNTGFTTQPNDLGGLTSIALIPAIMLSARRNISFRQRLSCCLLLFLVLAGLILSGSVGSILASLAAFAVWFIFQKGSRESRLVFAAIGLCVVGVVSVQVLRGAPTLLDRLHTVTHTANPATGDTQTGSVDLRIAVYRVAEKRIEANPFVGVGLDIVDISKPFGIISYNYDVHNLVIGMWYEAGILGLVGMTIVFFAFFRTGWIAVARSRSEDERMAALSLVCSVVAFLAFAMSEPVLYSRYAWISPALLVAMRAVQEREAATARAPTPLRARRGVLTPVVP